MKCDCHFTPRREVEEVVGKEAVIIGNGEINSLRELVRRQFDTEAVACARHCRRDSWLREFQLLEWREEVIVTCSHFPVHQQLAINKHILAVRSLQKL